VTVAELVTEKETEWEILGVLVALVVAVLLVVAVPVLENDVDFDSDNVADALNVSDCEGDEVIEVS